MTFGEYFKKLRLKSKVTLRQFCVDNGFDPGNISKLERGLMLPPRSEEKLDHYAAALGIKKGSDEYIEFLDLAASAHMTLSIKEITDQQLIEKLPVLFRTVDNKDLTPEKLERIIKLIEKEVKK